MPSDMTFLVVADTVAQPRGLHIYEERITVVVTIPDDEYRELMGAFRHDLT